MTICLSGNCRTGAITYTCSYKCHFDDVAKTATPINADGEIICKDCMSKLQTLISSIFIDNLDLIEDTKKVKKLKKIKRVDLIDLESD